MLLFVEDGINKYNKSKILVLAILVILWRLKSFMKLNSKEMLEDFTESPIETSLEIFSSIFELMGWFVFMIVVGELFRKLYRIIVKQVSSLHSKEQEKLEDQEALNISIILSGMVLIYSII